MVKRIKQEYSQAFIMPQPSSYHQKEESGNMAYISLAPPGAHQTFNEEEKNSHVNNDDVDDDHEIFETNSSQHNADQAVFNSKFDEFCDDCQTGR